MILIDGNLLIYAYNSASPEHATAKSWLDGQLNGQTRVGLPWHSLLAFARIVSNPRIFEHPVPMHDAWRKVMEWLDVQVAWIPAPTDRHASVIAEILAESRIASNDLPVAHLAALAIEHGLIVCSTDSDFARFRHIKWSNPLAASAT